MEKEKATHSSIHAWKIPWTEEPGGLQSMESQRVGHDWATSVCSSQSNSHIHTWLMEKPLLLFSHSVVSDSLSPYGLQHARLPCPSLSTRACSNSCPLSWWCHPTISSCHPLLLMPSIFPSIRVFSNELALHVRWTKYWSFSFSISSPMNIQD